MYLFAKFGGHRSYKNGDINSYMDALEKGWAHRLDLSYCKILKIRNTDLQFKSPGYDWQKSEKQKINRGSYKAFCVSGKNNNCKLLTILDSVMLYSNKPFKVVQIQKLASQLICS